MKILYCLIAVVVCLYIGFFIARMDKPEDSERFRFTFNREGKLIDAKADVIQEVEYDDLTGEFIIDDDSGELFFEEGLITIPENVGDLMYGFEAGDSHVYRYNGDEWEKLIPESECLKASSSSKMAP